MGLGPGPHEADPRSSQVQNVDDQVDQQAESDQDTEQFERITANDASFRDAGNPRPEEASCATNLLFRSG